MFASFVLVEIQAAQWFIRYSSSYSALSFPLYVFPVVAFGTDIAIVADLGLRVSMEMLVDLSNLIWGKGIVSCPYFSF